MMRRFRLLLSATNMINVPRTHVFVFCLFAIACLCQTTSPTLSVVPRGLFDSNRQLAKGQELHVVGSVEYSDPAEDLGANEVYGNLMVANGRFSILMDARGQEMGEAQDGRIVEVRCVLTGKYLSDVTTSLTSPTGGAVDKVIRVPEIRVLEYQARSPKTSNAPVVENGNGTITDTKTGLMWQKQDDGIKRSWNEAVQYAKAIRLAGHSDWHLPSEAQLMTLRRNVGLKKKLRDVYMPGVKDGYWTSTVRAGHSGRMVGIGFNPNGPESWDSDKAGTETSYVLCVRLARNTAQP